jgi:ribonuclease HI
MNNSKSVIIYTDGGCIGNPGPGGFGVVLLFGNTRKELSGGYRKTTNNRMELMAVINGLEALKEPCKVQVHSDSKYVVDSYRMGSAKRWRANGWMRDKKSPALNVDLWDRLLKLCEQHEVEMIWVEGHAGDTENERCDRLSNQAARGKTTLIDDAYEQGKTRMAAGSIF